MLGGERSAGMPQTRTNTPHSVNSGCCTLALHDSRSVRPLLPATGIVQRRHGILAARGLCRLERRAHGVESSHHSHHKVSAAAPAHPLGGGWGPLAFVAGHRWLLAGSAACFRFWALWPRAATTARKQLLPLSVCEFRVYARACCCHSASRSHRPAACAMALSHGSVAGRPSARLHTG